MASLDQLKQTFFEECDEALQQIEAGLTEIREGHSSDDTINAVFRAVHSVKGGAGIFGFEALVGFAHVFETVLDGLRRGSLTATPEMLDVLLSASDVLSDLVQMSRAGEAIPPGFGGECRAALEQIIEQRSQGAGGEDDNSPAPADFDGIDFTPVRVDWTSPIRMLDAGRRAHRYAITFRPKPEMLKKANEPLYILRESAQAGHARSGGSDWIACPHWPSLKPTIPISGGPARCKPRRRARRSTKSSSSSSTIASSRSSKRRPRPDPGGVPEAPAAPRPAESQEQHVVAPPLAPDAADADSKPASGGRGQRSASRRRLRPGRPPAKAGRHHDPDRTRNESIASSTWWANW